jgi:hypothetical protein
MKKCFYSGPDYCFLLSRDQSIPGDCQLFLFLDVGLTEEFLALISFP